MTVHLLFIRSVSVPFVIVEKSFLNICGQSSLFTCHPNPAFEFHLWYSLANAVFLSSEAITFGFDYFITIALCIYMLLHYLLYL